MNQDIILGKTLSHLVPLEGTKYLIHREMLPSLLKLQTSAKEDGFDLQVTSGFRDFDRQLKIWNAKARGEKELMDDFGSPLVYQVLTPNEILFSILRWSALPGASRHHWGSDIDVFDGRTQRLEDVQLIPSESEIGGPAYKLHQWLDEQIRMNKSFGFYRPYSSDRGGVSPERWHLSFAPLSQTFEKEMNLNLLRDTIENSQIELKDEILKNLEIIFKKYITNIESSPF